MGLLQTLKMVAASAARSRISPGPPNDNPIRRTDQSGHFPACFQTLRQAQLELEGNMDERDDTNQPIIPCPICGAATEMRFGLAGGACGVHFHCEACDQVVSATQ
jgi:hypothetical protein